MSSAPTTARATSFLEAEIRDQPAVLSRRSVDAQHATQAAADLLRRHSVDHILVLGRGSSGNAAVFGQYLLGDAWGVPVYRVDPSLWAGPQQPVARSAGVVAISQSGHADDLQAALATARHVGAPTVLLTNDVDAPVGAEADVVIPLGAGPEQAVPATKTYTATLHALVELAVAGGGADLAEGLNRLPDLMARCIDGSFAAVPAMVQQLVPAPGHPGLLTVVGLRTGHATAAEIALKIREVAGWTAESLSVPDLVHGPIAAMSAASVVWLVETTDGQRWPALRSRLERTDARVVAVAPRTGDAWTLPLPDEGLPVWLADVLAVVPGQIAALFLGLAAGRDVDQPAGLTKVTAAP